MRLYPSPLSTMAGPVPWYARSLLLAALFALLALLALSGCVGSPDALGEVEQVASPAGPGSTEPSLATGPDGRLYLSWQQPAADGAHELRFAVLEDGAWSESRTIARGSDWFVNWADFPALLPLDGERLVAHYLQKRPGGATYHYDVRVVQSTDAGRTWSAPISPYLDPTSAEHGFVSYFRVAGDSIGMVWLDGRKYDPAHGASEQMTLAYTTVVPGGGAAPERILDGRVCDCCQTAAAQTGRGPIVLYRNRSDREVRDIYAVRLVEGEWTEGAPVHHDGWQIEACPVNGPAVDAAGDTVVAAWFTAASDQPRVQVAFSTDAGATFGRPVRVDAGLPAGRVDVLLLGGDKALVSWLERTDDEQAEVRVRRVSAHDPPGSTTIVARSSSARASGFPRMARHGDDVVFAWTDPGPDGRVRVARATLTQEQS